MISIPGESFLFKIQTIFLKLHFVWNVCFFSICVSIAAFYSNTRDREREREKEGKGEKEREKKNEHPLKIGPTYVVLEH